MARGLNTFKIATLVVQLLAVSPYSVIAQQASCDTVQDGYTCNPALSQQWGEYSPYFTLANMPGSISTDVPPGCVVDFVQLLSRHGARFPDSDKVSDYNASVLVLQSGLTSFTGNYSFLANWTWNLGAENLTTFGEQEMYNSGVKFYDRYRLLTAFFEPFIRADQVYRCVQSAQNFSAGYHATREADILSDHNDGYPYNILVMSDNVGYNNTLDPSTCNNFETGWESGTSNAAEDTFEDTYLPSIITRIKAETGVKLAKSDVKDIMDMCPFETVNSPTGQISDFCYLFNSTEWTYYNAYRNLDKWYGYGGGNFLGAAQGAGWVSELIARLTSSSVIPGGSVNSTLDNDKSTFPLNYRLYADFSHDDQLTSMFTAMGLYDALISSGLSNTTITYPDAANNYYSAAWTVPFASRMYVEKMTCLGDLSEILSGNIIEEYVRLIINDKVIAIPSNICEADNYDRCTLTDFVNGQKAQVEMLVDQWNEFC